jgi:hypothetical protein
MISDKDKIVLRELAKRIEEISSQPQEKRSIELWKNVNMLRESRPPIRITEVPWNEMNVNDELTLQCEDEYCRELEMELRKTIYQTNHFHLNNVVENKISCPMAVYDNGFGFTSDYTTKSTDEKNDVRAFSYKPQIKNIDDVRKIRNTVVTHDESETKKRYDLMNYIFDGILKVELKGPSVRFSPWDNLIQWFGINDGLMMMREEPDLVHEAISRLIDAEIDRLEQYERLGVLTLNTGADQIGSGGLGYTDEFPDKNYDPKHIKAKDIWGSSAAQIFACVSPEMHKEFAFAYEVRLLEKFNKSYYGCCDPLDKKIDMLDMAKNLRKVSMSKWINIEAAAEKVGGKYVFSYKPNPAVFAESDWSIDSSRKELERLYESAKRFGCKVEVIMKNISTLRYEPNRLWEWANMAEEITDKYFG